MNELLNSLRDLLPGVPDSRLKVVIDVVSHGIGKLGGRPRKNTQLEPVPNGLVTGSEPDTNGIPVGPSDLISGSVSGSGSDLRISRSSGSGKGESDGRAGRNAHAFVASIFRDVWGKAYGEEYRPDAADRSQLGRMLREFKDVREIYDFPWREMFGNYLADQGQWAAEEHRHSLRIFCTGGGINKYRVRPKTNGFTQKELRGNVAGDLFVAAGRKP